MLENFKYIKNISNGVGTMLLYSQIGDSVDENGNLVWGINGSSFANEMLYLSNQCDSIDVRINSVGGSVLDGYSIVSAILNSSKPVNTYIDGLAASTAGWIAVSGAKCYMMDYGTFMLHNPSGGEDKKVLAMIKETIVTILSNRTSKTIEEIDTLMNKETWMSANECLSNGIVDEVISSGKKLKMPKKATLYDMALIYNKAINPVKNMTKINTLLKLQNEAGESEQEQAIVQLNKSLSEKEEELVELKNRLKAIEDEKAEAEKKAKEALVNKATVMAKNAQKEGKIAENEVEATILNASKDEASYEFVSNLINKSGKTSHKPFNPSNAGKMGEDKTNWTYNDWENKDVDGLKDMYVNNREPSNEIKKTRKGNK
mgnify:CR=1 FL=1